MIEKVHHIGIAVRSIERALQFYTGILKLQFEGSEIVESQGVKVAFLRAGEIHFELLEPISLSSPVHSFIEKRGEGIHHIAFAVPSIEERISSFKQKGLRMIDSEPRIGAGGAQIAFVHPASCGGVLYELYEKKPKGGNGDA